MVMKAHEESFYWFDYETFGTHPAMDRPCQFAGIRTDAELNIIGEPLLIYCKQAMDYLPHPAACRVTGLSPQYVNANGVCEADFISQIREQIGKPGTCSVGYNSIRFDDEFTRHALFRNFYDPYEHEWKDGNTRWDLLDVVRLTRALRPEGISWPLNEEGGPSNRLEDLSAANGIEHANAHDALSDVLATIGMARLIKQAQPKLYRFAYTNRGKLAASNILNVKDRKPCLQVSGMIPGNRHHLSAILPLARHPENANSVIVLDLYQDPSALLTLSTEQIIQKLYQPTDKHEPSAHQRPGLRTIQINKCPVLVPMSTLRPEDAERLKFDVERMQAHLDIAQALFEPDILNNISNAMSRSQASKPVDVDVSLYSGGFLSAHDKQHLDRLRAAPASQIQDIATGFEDRRLQELARRYQARNFPESLDNEQNAQWREHCHQRLDSSDAPWMTFSEMDDAIAHTDWTPEERDLKRALIDYCEQLRTFASEPAAG